MRLTLVFTFLILAICSSGQPKNNSKIQNILTSEHVNIKGTKINLIPPYGWTAANNFNGFLQSGSSSSLMVVEIPGSFEEVSKGLTEEGLKTQGVILDKKRTITINDYPGVFIISRQFAYETMFGKYILVFGNEQTTFIINGMFPLDFENEIGRMIEKSMLSVVYEPDKEISPVESVNFEIDVSNSKFKFAHMMSNTLVYNVDGLIPTNSDDKTALIVGTSLGKIEMEDKKQYALNRIKQYPSIKNVDTEQVKSITIDDVSGYEIIAKGIDDKTGEPEMIYQVLLFSDNCYYMIIGVAKTDFEENTELFRNIGRTFRRK